jgi:hypothetical protein
MRDEGQMLVSYQRGDKLAATRSDFEARRMVKGMVLRLLTDACEHAGSLVIN